MRILLLYYCKECHWFLVTLQVVIFLYNMVYHRYSDLPGLDTPSAAENIGHFCKHAYII